MTSKPKCSPCRDCENRTAECHGQCGLYAEYKQQLNDYKAEIASINKAEWDADGFLRHNRNAEMNRRSKDEALGYRRWRFHR